MLEAVVQELAGQRVVFGVGPKLAHVLGATQRAHASAGSLQKLGHQLGRNRGFEQLLLAGEVPVQVANRRASSTGHVGHRGGFVAQLGEGGRGRGDERFAHVLLGNLSHSKENYGFSFGSRKS